jgi:hypothetical protein
MSRGMDDANEKQTIPAEAKSLTPAASRALAEAEARRLSATDAADLPPETNGRNGPEPTRFGDWEKNGIVSDF